MLLKNKSLSTNWQLLLNKTKQSPLGPYLTSHSILIFNKTKNIINEKAHGLILDLGAGDLQYKNYVRGADRIYIAMDIKGKDVDVIGDAHKLPFKNEVFDTILCNQVLEHLNNPEKALSEIERILKFNGILILSTPMSIYLHDTPHDYYRFTEYGIEHLLKINKLELISKINICSIILVFIELLQIFIYTSIYLMAPYKILEKYLLYFFINFSKLSSKFDIKFFQLYFPANLLYVVEKKYYK